jgi:IclR family transcriptional regulator, pca regulon regulatory protein
MRSSWEDRRALGMSSRAVSYPDTWEMPDFSEPRYSQSLARGLAILECFRPARPMRRIADIADELGMSRSTTHRYVTTLVALGYLEQDTSRKYRLSLRVTDLGMSALNSTGLREQAHHILGELRRRSTFTASLAVLDGPGIVYVDRIPSHRRGQDKINIGVGIGSRVPAACTAMGKVLLAHLPERERREALSQATLERRGPNAIMSKTEMRAELEGVLEEGFATEDQESAEGLIAIAAPVRNESGEVIAAIDLAARTSTITVEQLADGLRSHLLAAADRISARLGYRREHEILAGD